MTYELRANQLVGAGGVGAIVDIGDESFVVGDITRWSRPDQQIIIPRMERRLRRDLLKPPANQKGSRGDVLLSRFPGSLFCNRAQCRRIVTNWNEATSGNPGGKPLCPSCGTEGSLVPMRFVAACKAGHLNDVPWKRWVTHSKESCPSRLKLLIGTGGTGGLESLVIKCVDCGANRDLSQIVTKDSMKAIGAKCFGTHPWRYDDASSCPEPLEVLQRGATNLYYPVTASALSLEVIEKDEAGQEDIRERDDFKFVLSMVEDANLDGNFVPPHIKNMVSKLAEKSGIPFEKVLEMIRTGSSAEESSAGDAGDWNETEVLREEWSFLKSSAAADFRASDLVCAESDLPRFRGQCPFDRVLLLHRLREVRAFLGYRRIDPSGELVTPEAGRPFSGGRPWLPAVEVFGEGIFLSFSKEWMENWERSVAEHPQEVERIATLERTRQKENFWFLPNVTARYIALHTFAHSLMRQLVFESGYSSSALRERIYAGPDMAGVLLYTADGDSEGSLGGLVRQGQPNRLGDTIRLSLDKAVWCSADPVCSETAGQGLGGFNRAACHACSLVPETSCATANTLLDRGFMLGRNGMPGLLSALL
ncbi:DrmB family protein [Sphingomonas sp. Leaf38]|uniref:DrmB family protein n=1 Tax=Sphingomonas sp. Leaf38 TaxID=1736217 RepID=UPI0006F26382|nr:DrmB family protein [Sphingomonas sp. Leaf38]KQN24703.1 hypothetical protein ASE88_16870 [Sphingomonas sp. Leaf38]